MRRVRALAAALAVASLWVTVVPAAQAAPKYCRAWRVQGQTWYAGQSNGFSLMFTLRMGSPTSKVFSGFARYNRGDPTEGGVPSQFIRGGVDSDGVGRIKMDIVWSSGSSGQYHATAYGVRRRSNGTLIAGLQGTTVDTSGGGGAARWWADGTGPGLGKPGGNWPLWCPASAVVR